MQENGLVPIVEPEVTLGPGDYTIEENAYWSEHVYSHVFHLLNEYNVLLEGILLKPNMCLPGEHRMPLFSALDTPRISPLNALEVGACQSHTLKIPSSRKSAVSAAAICQAKLLMLLEQSWASSDMANIDRVGS